MPLDFAITALVTLFVVVDPIGLAPTFLAVTEGLPRRARCGMRFRKSTRADLPSADRDVGLANLQASLYLLNQ